MLTVDDLRNHSRQSGFDHVKKAPKPPGTRRFQAQFNGATGPGLGMGWCGPWRVTGEEAAQDACDYKNGKQLTIEDIRNPARKSGFDHVVSAMPGQNGHSATTPKWRGHLYGEPGETPLYPSNNMTWQGPARPTPEAAAQDVCDRVNGQQSNVVRMPRSQRKRPQRPKRIKPDMPADIAAKDAEVEAWKRREYEKIDGQNYVYLVGMLGHPEGGVKVGESKAYEHRIATNNTFNPYDLVILAVLPDDMSVGADKVLHRLWAEHRIHPNREWFRPVEQVLSHFGITHDEFLRRCGGKTEEVKQTA